MVPRRRIGRRPIAGRPGNRGRRRLPSTSPDPVSFFSRALAGRGPGAPPRADDAPGGGGGSSEAPCSFPPPPAASAEMVHRARRRIPAQLLARSWSAVQPLGPESPTLASAPSGPISGIRRGPLREALRDRPKKEAPTRSRRRPWTSWPPKKKLAGWRPFPRRLVRLAARLLSRSSSTDGRPDLHSVRSQGALEPCVRRVSAA